MSISTSTLGALGPSSASSELAKSIAESGMLSDQVVALLYRELVSGRLQQGHPINEAQLARELGISRNPIREAVRRLEERGLLVSTPRRGTAVRTFTKADIDDIFSLRIVLESFALQQALPRMSPADHAGISGIVDAMVAAAAANSEVDLIENDILFHRRICELSGNRQTVRAFDNINGEMRLLIALIERQFESLHDAAIDHIPVAQAIATGDVDYAVATMREHIEASWRLTSASYDTK